jgi:hypothetical protein
MTGFGVSRGPEVLIGEQGSVYGIKLDIRKGIEWTGGHSRGLRAWEERNCQT